MTTTPSGARIVWHRSAAAFVVGGVLTALLLGVPTDVIPNGWFGRMTPVEDYAVPALVATSVLSGLLVANLQAFIFALLSGIYIGTAAEPHH